MNYGVRGRLGGQIANGLPTFHQTMTMIDTIHVISSSLQVMSQESPFSVLGNA